MRPMRPRHKKAGEKPAQIDPAQAVWPKDPPPAAKNDAAPPAQPELTADPWAIEKVSRVSAQTICLACQGGHAQRSASGVWRVGVEALAHMGYDRALAGRWLEEAQPHGCDPDLEGGVVVARSGRGTVTVRSTAAAPAEAMFLARVREPSPLRCGDEVAVRVASGATREVVHGR